MAKERATPAPSCYVTYAAPYAPNDPPAIHATAEAAKAHLLDAGNAHNLVRVYTCPAKEVRRRPHHPHQLLLPEGAGWLEVSPTEL